MINNIETTIAALSTFPDRPGYASARAYATAVATWLRENKELSEALATLIPELNVVIEQFNTTTVEINEIEENVQNIKDTALSEVGQLKTDTQNIKEENQGIYEGTVSIKDEANQLKNLAQKYAVEFEDIEVEEGKFSAMHWALKAYAAVATLPEGTLLDTLIALDKTWSSYKIKYELDSKADKDQTDIAILGKQDLLVSGTNIKRINGIDLLGADDIVIQSGTTLLFDKALFGGI